jgi:hypothetical protein
MWLLMLHGILKLLICYRPDCVKCAASGSDSAVLTGNAQFESVPEAVVDRQQKYIAYRFKDGRDTARSERACRAVDDGKPHDHMHGGLADFFSRASGVAFAL